jgi:iron complex outermembrane receptor protein
MKFPSKLLTTIFAIAPLTIYAETTAVVEIIGEKIKQQSPNADEVAADTLAAQRASTSDTAQLLQNAPGVSLYGAGGISSLPVIHGMADDRVRVQVNGMDLMSSCPNHMNSPLSYIDPSNVASIKVFAGITPVSSGGDSIGGTILVNSVEPEFTTSGTLIKGQAGTFYRSNGNGVGGNLSTSYANEIINLTYNGSYAQSQNTNAAHDFKPAGLAAADRGFLDGDVIGSSAFKSINNELGLAMRHENHTINFKVGVQHVPYELFPNQRMDMTGNLNRQFNLQYKGKYQWGSIEARVFEQLTNHAMQFGEDKQFVYGTALGMPMESESKTQGLALHADIFSSDNDTIKLGGEILNYHLNDWWPAATTTMGAMGPDNFQNINNGHRNRLSVFGEWDINWNERWFSQLGIRSETVNMNTGDVHGYNNMPMYAADAAAFNAQNHQRTDNNIDFTALIKYVASAKETIEFGYAQKTRSPNLYERYSWSASSMTSIMNNMVGDGNGYVGNLNLNPEVAHTVSATLDLHDATNEQWQLKVTPYYSYVTDYIDAQRCPVSVSANCSAANLDAKNSFVNLQYINQTAQLLGMDLSGYINMGSLTLSGVMNYTRGKNLTTGDNLYNIMPLNTKFTLTQKMNNWTNAVEWQLVAAKTKISEVRNEHQTGGYGLLNLRSSYTWKQARFDIGIENVLNQFYEQPLGGAYVGQGKTMSINGIPWGVTVPGLGRSINVAVNLKF